MYNTCNNCRAVARLRGGRGAPDLTGEAQFLQRRDGVLVTVMISGLPADNPDGFFALHIHEGDSCGGTDFAQTGGHFNPEEAPHPHHAGDLPPLLDCGGRAYLAVLTDRFSLPDIIGRTVVIHGGRDDFRTQPSGDAGAKIACGEIRWG